jgi:hypothetical protein
MGQVLLTFEIMPDGLEVDLNGMRKNVEAKLKSYCKIEQVEVKPIAFGLSALMMNAWSRTLPLCRMCRMRACLPLTKSKPVISSFADCRLPATL